MSDSEEEYDGPWVTASMICAVCNYEWVAVYPACAPALECDGCGYMNARHDELAPESL